MKVVINKCFGGFSLSALAIKRLSELEGKECYFYKHNFSNTYKKIPIEDCKGYTMWSAFTEGDEDKLNEFLNTYPQDFSNGKDEYDETYELISLDIRPNIRHDKLLVMVVEELGDKANGMCAELEVIKIPDDVDYEIVEYDGFEHIAEKHRTWS